MLKCHLYIIHLNSFCPFCSVRVSNELGRGNGKAAKFAIKVVFGTSLAIGLVLFILFLALGNVISYAFTSSAAVAKVVSGLSVLLSVTVLLNSIQPVFNGKFSSSYLLHFLCVILLKILSKIRS